jgi:hypothetical protein
MRWSALQCCSRITFIAVLLSLLILGAAEARAQNWHTFTTAGFGTIDYGPSVSRGTAFQVSNGLLYGLAGDRLRVGGQLDVLFSGGSVTPRGGPLAESQFLRSSRLRPLINGGYFRAEDGGHWVAGGGVEVKILGQRGIRVAVQDIIRRSGVTGPFGSMHRTIHEPSLQIGIAWR